MTKRSAACTRPRSRRERLVRYLLRKRPCTIIMTVQLVCLVLLALLLAGGVLGILRLQEKNRQLDEEDRRLVAMAKHITFAHCSYKDLKPFNTTFCSSRVGVESYAWRNYELTDDEDDPSCLDRQEQTFCRDASVLQINPFDDDYSYRLPQCAGVHKADLPSTESDDNVFAPIVHPNELPAHLGKQVLAQELFALCPKCGVRTRQFQLDAVCKVKVQTLARGWPALVQVCNDVSQITHASKKCDDV